MPKPQSKQLTGAAGEYFVAAELSRLGWAASITPKGVPETDVLAWHLDSKRLVAVQVKTATAPSRFRLHERNETPIPSHWFVLVRLGDEMSRPEFFVLPSLVVSAYVWVSHRVWSAQPRRDGKPRSLSPHTMRAIKPDDVEPYYRDRWDLLLAPAEKAPLLLPVWIHEGAGQHGLPEGHPGLGRVSPV